MLYHDDPVSMANRKREALHEAVSKPHIDVKFSVGSDTLNERVDTEALGKKAFKKGKISIPVNDPELMKILKQLSGPIGNSPEFNKAMEGWLKGWHFEQRKQAEIEWQKVLKGLDK